ncbi:ABC transporter ATP-binding protein [Paenibacillus sp. 453mf]|uniref:ATP-binding cassette domain-containing protein n=1 Tax=Paenibacillus sp. 453mf TaxID=1761874 RepID=UPI0008EEC511|nr:ABC transporter ATP-binding protein [Paenibacillus sp. 453mf]SFS70121.1 peptide/nickel transport system ATP-binding protein [Paenibacillus sp. 453mf]
MALLEIDNLSVSFARSKGLFKVEETEVIHGLSMTVEAGRITAVVGASGSGKSLLAHAILGILPSNAITRGTLHFNGTLMNNAAKEELRGSRLALVPQSVQYFDPLMKVGAQVSYSFERSKDRYESIKMTGSNIARRHERKNLERKRLDDILSKYGLAIEVTERYPFELSGGMARRVLLSIATAGEPDLIIADEPTPGIHVEALSETLKHFRSIANQGAGILWITHDIESALQIADELVVFYAGTNVESARPGDFTGRGEQLRHPYSKALWNALPHNGFKMPPGPQLTLDSNHRSRGCMYAHRCPMATWECTEVLPLLRELRGGEVRCIHAT